MNLQEKILEFQSKSPTRRMPKEITREHFELAVLYAKGEVGIAVAAKILSLSNGAAAGVLASILVRGIREGKIDISLRNE